MQCPPALSYPSERKRRVESVINHRQIIRPPKINGLDAVQLISPGQIPVSNMYAEEEEPTATKLQKIQSSVQGIERFSGRLGAAFAKKKPQVGILNNAKRNVSKSNSKKRTKNLFGL